MCVLPVFIPRQEDKGIANPSGVHLRLKQSLRRTIASMYCSLGSCTKNIDIWVMRNLLRQKKFMIPLLLKVSGWDKDPQLENLRYFLFTDLNIVFSHCLGARSTEVLSKSLSLEREKKWGKGGVTLPISVQKIWTLGGMIWQRTWWEC